MRKLFRMKYESCSGQCYAYSDVMRIHTLGLDVESAVTFLKDLVAIHEPSCGNDKIGYRLDHDIVGETDVFIASFEHYGSLDLFSGSTPLEAMQKLIKAALSYYASDEWQGSGLGHDVCHHGDNKKLISFAISFSGLDETEQENLRARFI